MTTAQRYHDISVGHRVVGHEGKCKYLHGHNYRIHFVVKSNNDELDSVGRVIDFSVIKSKLCQWLEDNWDHKFLMWEKDPILEHMPLVTRSGICVVPFNPTAENIAEYLVIEKAPILLKGTGCTLIECIVEETRKCSATYKL